MAGASVDCLFNFEDEEAQAMRLEADNEPAEYSEPEDDAESVEDDNNDLMQSNPLAGPGEKGIESVDISSLASQPRKVRSTIEFRRKVILAYRRHNSDPSKKKLSYYKLAESLGLTEGAVRRYE
jgi:hypothetical protein